MSQFPRLRTNAITQYPSGTGDSRRTEVLRFLDGSEQRFRQWGSGRRSWTVRLDLLDEGEIDGLRRFFQAQSGRYGTFTFVDPWTEEEYDGCAFESDTFDAEFRAINRATTTIRILQVEK